MKAPLLLRISSVISLLFSVGHILGGRKAWSPLGETEGLQAMRTFRFEAMGVSRTYMDFYLGFGHSISVYMLMQTVLLWQLAGLAANEPRRVRPMIACITLASLASVALCWLYIFPLPTVFSAVLTVCLALAWWAAR